MIATIVIVVGLTFVALLVWGVTVAANHVEDQAHGGHDRQ